ncbi:hypothetical protein B0H13DRAFT_1921766 [Mycena leptocephala]|nr:hypothetical protein B0H13DRAFT_1921766 [Mycena leptocephala]
MPRYTERPSNGSLSTLSSGFSENGRELQVRICRIPEFEISKQSPETQTCEVRAAPSMWTGSSAERERTGGKHWERLGRRGGDSEAERSRRRDEVGERGAQYEVGDGESGHRGGVVSRWGTSDLAIDIDINKGRDASDLHRGTCIFSKNERIRMERIAGMENKSKLNDTESSGECACGNIGNIHKRMERSRQLLTLRERKRDGRVAWEALRRAGIGIRLTESREERKGRAGAEQSNVLASNTFERVAGQIRVDESQAARKFDLISKSPQWARAKFNEHSRAKLNGALKREWEAAKRPTSPLYYFSQFQSRLGHHCAEWQIETLACTIDTVLFNAASCVCEKGEWVSICGGIPPHIGSADPRFLSVCAPSTGLLWLEVSLDLVPGPFPYRGFPSRKALHGFFEHDERCVIVLILIPVPKITHGVPNTRDRNSSGISLTAVGTPLSFSIPSTNKRNSATHRLRHLRQLHNRTRRLFRQCGQSLGQGPASTSPLVTLNGSPSVTLSGDPMSESSAQAPVSLQPPEHPSAGIHRHALSTGAIVGVALVIVTVVLTLTILFCRHHRRRDQSGMVSPFENLASGTSANLSTPSEIQTDASAARVQYLEKELRGARAEMVEIGSSAQIVERRVPDDAGGSAEEPTAEGSIPERANSNDQQSGADGWTAALLARIRELESQIRGTRASGLSDDPPPGYTA